MTFSRKTFVVSIFITFFFLAGCSATGGTTSGPQNVQEVSPEVRPIPPQPPQEEIQEDDGLGTAQSAQNTKTSMAQMGKARPPHAQGKKKQQSLCSQQRQNQYQLSRDDINSSIRTVSSKLSPCILAMSKRNPQVTKVRIMWLIKSDGKGMNWSLSPNEPALVQCMTPVLESIQFPCIKAYRQRADFNILIRNPNQPRPKQAKTPHKSQFPQGPVPQKKNQRYIQQSTTTP